MEGSDGELRKAVVCCDEDAALEALAAGASFEDVERETGYTVLHYACQYGMSRLVQSLLQKYSPNSIQARTKDLILQNAVVQPGGQTALHLAARAGELEVVELLLEKLADPAARDVDGFTPAEAALQHENEKLAKHLAELAHNDLPTAEMLQQMIANSISAGRKRAADALEVPEYLRRSFTVEKVLTERECQHVLEAVKKVAESRASLGNKSHMDSDGWTTNRHAAYATTDLPCNLIPSIDAWVRSFVRQTIFPRIASRYGWEPQDGSCLDFRDLFFVRYAAGKNGQSGLALHRDGSIVSFNILLNEPTDFDGGGTYIEADDTVYTIGQGDCFVHSGKLRHGGYPITRGERFVLVAFLDLVNEEET